MGGYYTEQDLWFSALYGGAVYRKTGETGERLGPVARGPVEKRGKRTVSIGGVSRGNAPGISILPVSGTSPALENLTTGESVYLRRLPDGADQAAFARRILSPPPSDLALWPVDLLPLATERQRESCTLWADHAYVPEGGNWESGKNVGNGEGRESGQTAAACVFSLSDHSGLRNGQSVLDSLGPLNWRNGAARSLAVRVTEGVDRLNRDGWLWNDFHPSRLFFQEDGQVFFDYSNLTAPVGEASVFYRPGNYPLEFGDPAVIRGIVPRPDGRSQNYSLCALLFYILFGRCPCDGTLLAGCPDDDSYNHYVKFRDYHRMPLFLFDPEDDQNAPGVFAEDEELTALWQACPEELRWLFTDALCRASAERRGGKVPEPVELLDCFRRLGWGRGGKGRRAKR